MDSSVDVCDLMIRLLCAECPDRECAGETGDEDRGSTWTHSKLMDCIRKHFKKITHITLYDLEKQIVLCEGDKIVTRYEVIDSEDAFDEGFTSRWNVKEYKEK